MPPSGRTSRPGGGSARLARYGLVRIGRAAELLTGAPLGWWDPAVGPVDEGAESVLTAFSTVGDPDLALLSIHRLSTSLDDPAELVQALREDAGLRARLLGVLGASAAFGDQLVGQPLLWRELRTGDCADDRPTSADLTARMLVTVEAADADGPAAVTGPRAVLALRDEYRRRLLCTAARDITGVADLDETASSLSELADALLVAALAVARAGLPSTATPARLAVIAMGKCGGRELNYVSDVDVLFVAEPVADTDATDPTPALRTAGRLASAMMRVCQQVAWPVDAALRPEGKDGPLVRTLASHHAYYTKWARTWEFQALLKARPAAGDFALGQEWLDMVAPLVWRAADRDGVVADVRAMRQRVLDTLPAAEAPREIKLGPGGLRDIEFAVQLLQLVHGRSDEKLRSPTTLIALQRLTDAGYVGVADGAELAEAYRFLRTVEHRLQLQHLRRTHRVPDEDDAVRWLARSLGFTADGSTDAAGSFLKEWTKRAKNVRRLHEKLFFRPLLEAVARVPSAALRLSTVEARNRLSVLGFEDPAGALRHVEALTAGVSRTASIQRTLLPAMLLAFADSPDPDAGLLAYRKVSELLGRTPWYLRLLRDEGMVADRMATLLGSSRYVAELLARDPEALRLLASDSELTPRTPDALRSAASYAAARYDDPVAAIAALRALRRRELLRIACADLLGLLDVEAVGAALSAVTDAVLAAVLETARRLIGREFEGGVLPVRMAIIAMGRLGGEEIGYSSDADVMFVHEMIDPDGDSAAANKTAAAIAERLRRLLSTRTSDPPLTVDAGLRPEGKQGALSRSLSSYGAYYERWSNTWESQALLRARVAAGDADLGKRFLALADPIRYPAGGLSPAQVIEIRRLKARMDTERLPRGADPATHTKLGRGGLADVEWTVQLLQLEHGAEMPGLRTTGTIAALRAAAEADLLNAEDTEAMVAAWRQATEIRNAMMLVRGRPSDQVPRQGRELAGVIWAMRRDAEANPGAFLDEYLRRSRHARQAVERVFGS